MLLPSALPRFVRRSAAGSGHVVCLVLVGLAVLCCMLNGSSKDMSWEAAGHHTTTERLRAEAVTSDEAETIGFTDGAGAHDHGDGSCNGDPQLVVGNVPPFHPSSALTSAPDSAPANQAGKDLEWQPSGTARLPTSVPHLLCVLRT